MGCQFIKTKLSAYINAYDFDRKQKTFFDILHIMYQYGIVHCQKYILKFQVLTFSRSRYYKGIIFNLCMFRWKKSCVIPIIIDNFLFYQQIKKIM